MFKLVSINIEWDKHLDLVLPFIKREAPDVLCIQEIFESDHAVFEKELEMKGVFAPMVRVIPTMGGPSQPTGVALFTKEQQAETSVEYYYGSADAVADLDAKPFDEEARPLVSVRVRFGENDYNVGTTHFTWTGNAESSDRQREDIKVLLDLVKGKDRLILCGDFNAPRGGEIFTLLSKNFKDNIPLHYKTSIDKKFHRKGDLQLVVDGLFTTDDVRTENVRLVDGLSDHMAIVAEIE